LRAASSLRDLTSLRGGTMRNFDFAIQQHSSTFELLNFSTLTGRASAIWVTELVFRLFACTTLAIHVQQLRQLNGNSPIKWSYRAAPVSIQSGVYGYANLRHAEMSTKNENQ
jgi:hypothetical protein